ncbi:hypothetical protein RND81_05G012500 [Saponaria officinalis]|uniref:Late embryogenesis abundant protein LEA-2 subgroup domain-containing protein n=1 Tax=Saponaria officinalis TaxID=3572 RepID=A0AAW1KTR7_SAPOF
MGIKDCSHHEYKRKKLIRRIFFTVLAFIIIILLTVLIIWAVLRPTKPKFILQDATLYNFTLTSQTQLNSIFQVTIQARNPNDKVGIYYDGLRTSAFYQNQPITLQTSIPPTYQDTEGTDVWSPYLQGQSVPIAPYLGSEIGQDLALGSVQVVIKMDGWVRFKVGTFVSGSYRIHVNCNALIPIGNPNSGVYVSRNVVKYPLVKTCDVDV